LLSTARENCPKGLRPDQDKAAGIYRIDVVEMNDPQDDALWQRIEEQGVGIYRRNLH